MWYNIIVGNNIPTKKESELIKKMKKEKHIEINGVNFEKVRGGVNNINTNLKTLCECYDRPSIYKVNIYNEWVNYAREVGASKWGIASYNANIFTFDFIFSFNDVIYYAHITPSHNYICEVL